MMRTMALRVFALFLCLILPAAALADTYLSEDGATHVDFTLGLGLHADGFPQSKAHLDDWEAFLNGVDLHGSLDGQAFLQPESRVYIDAAVRIDGEDKIPFIYDGYHSYRYIVSPVFKGDSVHFQMHNFFDFMLKPYYFMELPTQYLALFLYPNATWYIAESYYTPVAEMIEEAREESLMDAGDGLPESITYNIPYEQLFELCEGLNYLMTDDCYRVYCYFDVLLAELYASSMMTDTLSNLEFVLDELDPYEEGMTVEETLGGMVCTLGETEVFTKSVTGGITEISLQLPIPMDYRITFDYRRENTGDANNISAVAAISYDGELAVSLSLEGEGLPAEGALKGEGFITAEMDGYVFEEIPSLQTLQFSWSRSAAKMPFDLEFTVDWIHPETALPAFSLYFSGAFEERDKSVLKDMNYPQDDFFSLNDMFLQEHKKRWLPTIGLYLLPVVLEMPAGVIDDTVNFLLDTNILISLIE